MKRNVMKTVLTIGILALAGRALGDECWSAQEGSTLVPLEKTAVRMSHERVDFFYAWPTADADASVTVIAEFVLINETDKPEKALVYLPRTYGDEIFREVDGKDAKKEDREMKEGGMMSGVTEISFAPHEKRVVRVKYKSSRINSDFSTGRTNWSYLLRGTDGLWNGNPEETVIVGHFPQMMPSGGFGPFVAEALEMTPPPEKTDGRIVTWIFKGVPAESYLSVATDEEKQLKASDPLNLADEKTAPELTLKQALKLGDLAGVKLLKALQEKYPDSLEPGETEYHLGRLYRSRFRSLQWIKISGADALAAAAHYEKALKNGLTGSCRQDALAQLIAIYSKDEIDTQKMEACVTALTAEKMKWSKENEELLWIVFEASPATALTTAKSVHAEGDEDKAAFKKQTEYFELFATPEKN